MCKCVSHFQMEKYGTFVFLSSEFENKRQELLLWSGHYLEKWSTLMSEIFNLSDLRYFICHPSEREEHWTLCTRRQTLDEPHPEF